MPSHLPEHIELKVGQAVDLEFAGLATAGYRWREEVAGEPDVIAVSWRRGFKDDPSTHNAGRSAPEIATIRAARRGTVRVKFLQARPWEKTVEPHDVHVIVVDVRP